MAATALIRFTQGLVAGEAGRALKGELTTPVVVTNASNVDVGSWQIDLVYVEASSSLEVTVPYAFGNTNAPTASFVPDVRGSYRIVLKVWNLPGRTGKPTDVDIRVFTVVGTNGLVIPPAQVWPLPLPDLRSGDPGAKPNEMNFAGQLDGWAGDGSIPGLINQLVRLYQPVPDPNSVRVRDALMSVGVVHPVAVVPLLGAPWVVCKGDAAVGTPPSLVLLDAESGNTVHAVYGDVSETWGNACVGSDGNIWVVGDTTFGMRFMRCIYSIDPFRTYSRVMLGETPGSTLYVTSSGGPPCPLVSDGTRLWTVTRDYAVSLTPSDLSLDYVAPSAGDIPDPIRPIWVDFDPTPANYADDVPRVWLISETERAAVSEDTYVQVDRIVPSTAVVDAHVVLPGGSQATYNVVQVVAAGAVIYAVRQGITWDGGSTPQFYAMVPDLPSSSPGSFFLDGGDDLTQPLGVSYDSVTGSFAIVAQHTLPSTSQVLAAVEAAHVGGQGSIAIGAPVVITTAPRSDLVAASIALFRDSFLPSVIGAYRYLPTGSFPAATKTTAPGDFGFVIRYNGQLQATDRGTDLVGRILQYVPAKAPTTHGELCKELGTFVATDAHTNPDRLLTSIPIEWADTLLTKIRVEALVQRAQYPEAQPATYGCISHLGLFQNGALVGEGDMVSVNGPSSNLGYQHSLRFVVSPPFVNVLATSAVDGTCSWKLTGYFSCSEA